MTLIRVVLGALVVVCGCQASAQRVTLVAVGDICLAHGVERRMEQAGSGYPFAAMGPILHDADIVFGNLECCLADGGKPVPKKYNFRGRPKNAYALRDAGFTAVSLANNHSLDFGKDGLAETLDSLERAGVIAVGAGRSIREAHALQIVKVRGVRVGFLAYLGLFPPVVKLTDDEPAVSMADLETIKADVAWARSRVDILVVSMHAGKEYTFRHNGRQAAIAHAAIDAGADIVIGHHPHVVQDAEVYRGKPIFYSLGNFVFDPSPTFLKQPDQRWSGMVVATLEKGAAPRARLIDLRIVDRQPRLRDRQLAASIRQELRASRSVLAEPEGVGPR